MRSSSSYPEGTIANIGSGLDKTFERADNGKLRWYDLDLPDVIELRGKFVVQNERRKFFEASVLEKDWLDQIEVQGSVLFIPAGVFYYFTEQKIHAFILQLLEKYPGGELVFDVCSPTGMRITNKIVIESSRLDEKSNLTWGLKNKKDLLAWDSRIKLIGTYYYFRTFRLSLKNVRMGILVDHLEVQYMLDLRLGGRT